MVIRMEAEILSFNAVSPTLKIVLSIWEVLYKNLSIREVNLLPPVKLQQRFTQKPSLVLSRRCCG